MFYFTDVNQFKVFKTRTKEFYLLNIETDTVKASIGFNS